MRHAFLLILSCLFSSGIVAQTGLTKLPVPVAGRYDDIHFINDSVGWVAGGVTTSGFARIFATRDGGETWKQQFMIHKYLRSIKFATEKLGFCGSLDSTLYRTIDGGANWTDISALLPKRPKGICGLSCPDSSTVYGVGRYNAGAAVIKSTDGGNTWTYIDMTGYTKGLVDVYFFNKNVGFVTGTSDIYGGVILYTNDGGANWSYKFKTGINEDIIWKIQTPDNVNFFASVESQPFTNNSRYLRSSDGGQTWKSVTWSNTYIRIQGIGFINPQVGWVGGDNQLYKTTDGGDHWMEDEFKAPAFDRMCRINSKIAYLSGQGVFKYDMLSLGNNGNTKPDNIHFLSVTPNPIKDVLRIQPVFKYKTYAILSVYDFNGVLISRPLDRYVKAGSLTVKTDLSNKAAGVYYVTLKTNEGMIYKKVIKK